MPRDHFKTSPDFAAQPPARPAGHSIIDTHKGWTIARDSDSGQFIIYRPGGRRYGSTPTEAGARVMRRRGIERQESRA